MKNISSAIAQVLKKYSPLFWGGLSLILVVSFGLWVNAERKSNIAFMNSPAQPEYVRCWDKISAFYYYPKSHMLDGSCDHLANLDKLIGSNDCGLWLEDYPYLVFSIPDTCALISDIFHGTDIIHVPTPEEDKETMKRLMEFVQESGDLGRALENSTEKNKYEEFVRKFVDLQKELGRPK